MLFNLNFNITFILSLTPESVAFISFACAAENVDTDNNDDNGVAQESMAAYLIIYAFTKIKIQPLTIVARDDKRYTLATTKKATISSTLFTVTL